MPRKSNSPEKVRDGIIDAALGLAAEKGWRDLSLREICDGASCDLATLRQHFSSKAAILNAFIKRVDTQVLAESSQGEEETPRDLLFDVIMRRFDALTPHKKALTNIVGDFKRTPSLGICALPQILCSLSWMMEAAGIRTRGLRGTVKLHGLALIYGRAWGVWLKDESSDLAATMAAVDGMLERAEKAINWRCRRASTPTDEVVEATV